MTFCGLNTRVWFLTEWYALHVNPHVECVTLLYRQRINFIYTLQHACGRVIGRNGDNIRNVSRVSNAKIIVAGSSTDTRELSKQSFSVQMQ